MIKTLYDVSKATWSEKGITKFEIDVLKETSHHYYLSDRPTYDFVLTGFDRMKDAFYIRKYDYFETFAEAKERVMTQLNDRIKELHYSIASMSLTKTALEEKLKEIEAQQDVLNG